MLPAHPVGTVLQAVCPPEKALKLDARLEAGFPNPQSPLSWKTLPLTQPGPAHAWAPRVPLSPSGREVAGAELQFLSVLSAPEKIIMKMAFVD